MLGNTNAADGGTFGNAIDFSANALVPTAPNTGSETTSPHRPVLTGATAIGPAGCAMAVLGLHLPIRSPAFTFEANDHQI